MKLIDIKPITESKLVFKKIDYNEFERLGGSSDDYAETEIDGKRVLVHYAQDGTVDALFYVSKKIGSYCKGFNDEDAVAFAELDTNWPYGN